jgi:DNA-binding protein Fis
VERPLIKNILEVTDWNKVKAARILGINRNTLHSKIEKLNIKKSSAGKRKGRKK